MPTVSVILDNAPIACVLAANDIDYGAFYGRRLDPLLPQKIYATYQVIKTIYDKDNNYDGIYATSQRLWELMGRYGIAAQGYTSDGGVVVGPGGSSITGVIPITYRISALITVEGTTYQNDELIGAVQVAYIIVDDAVYQAIKGDFVFSSSTGTINIEPNVLYVGQAITIAYSRYISVGGGTVPIVTSVIIQYVDSYAEAAALTNKTTWVEVAEDETKGNQRSMYAFQGDGSLEFQYAVPD